MISKKVFISNTTLDLAQYRGVAVEVINLAERNAGGNISLIPMDMDGPISGEQSSPEAISRGWAAQADWVILIVAWHYGTVPLGSKISITESEYREAVKNKQRKLFVLMPGEKSKKQGPDEIYRAAKSETSDLKDFREEGDETSRASVERFKGELKDAGQVKFFRDIDHFREILASSLNLAIIEEIARELKVEFIRLGLTSKVQRCVAEVKSLAGLKKIHDCLHKIRQFGIRQWRETLLASWPENDEPTPKMVDDYRKKKERVVALLGEINGLTNELVPETRMFLPQISELPRFKLSDLPYGIREDFIESTEEFAGLVQKVFTACNDQMRERAKDLNEAFLDLDMSTDDALEKNALNPKRAALLTSETKISRIIHERLQTILTNHYEWQAVHDSLEKVDAKIEVDVKAVEDAANLVPRIQRTLIASADILNKYKDAVDLLDEWPGLIKKVELHLGDFSQAPNADRYRDMRKVFDDLFYDVDAATRRVVELSESRVKAIEAGLK